MEEKRRSPRARCRLACTLEADGRRADGVVRDVSAGGVAVQTELGASEGEPLCLRVRPPSGGPVVVNAIVWHAHRVRSRRTGERGFLLGLVVSNPPDAWFTRVGAPQIAGAPEPCAWTPPPAPESSSPASCCDAGPEKTFVVRLKQSSSPRTRTYRLEAATLEAARSEAAAEADAGWRVIEVHAA